MKAAGLQNVLLGFPADLTHVPVEAQVTVHAFSYWAKTFLATYFIAEPDTHLGLWKS